MAAFSCLCYIIQWPQQQQHHQQQRQQNSKRSTITSDNNGPRNANGRHGRRATFYAVRQASSRDHQREQGQYYNAQVHTPPLDRDWYFYSHFHCGCGFSKEYDLAILDIASIWSMKSNLNQRSMATPQSITISYSTTSLASDKEEKYQSNLDSIEKSNF
jgi:hypothetical protein